MIGGKQLAPIEQRAPARGLMRSDPLLPLINVGYLLLTFFLIICALQTSTAVSTLLPHGGAQIAARSGALTLRIEASGVLHFEGRAMPVSEAVAAIRSALAAPSRDSLNIQADRSTPASTIVPLLKKLRDGGIASIRLIPVRQVGPS
jgi:biopolymer transport protein ExbD